MPVVYSSKRKNGCTATWRKLENTQSERKKPETKILYCMIHLNEMSEIGKSMQTESRSVTTQG